MLGTKLLLTRMFQQMALQCLVGDVVYPSIAQLVERWTVEVVVIHRSLVRIRLEGLSFFFHLVLHTCSWLVVYCMYRWFVHAV